MSWVDGLKKRWGLRTTWDVVAVLIVFSVTGSASVLVRKPVFAWLNVTADTSLLIKIPLYVAVIFPTYQVLLLVFGFAFGQWSFFWNFEKKMLRRLRILPKKPTEPHANSKGSDDVG